MGFVVQLMTMTRQNGLGLATSVMRLTAVESLRCKFSYELSQQHERRGPGRPLRLFLRIHLPKGLAWQLRLFGWSN